MQIGMERSTLGPETVLQPWGHGASPAQLAQLSSGKAFPEGNLGKTVKSPEKVHTV